MDSKYSSGSTAVVTDMDESNNMDFESVPEFVREPRSKSYKDSYALNKESPRAKSTREALVKKEPFYLRKDLYVTTTADQNSSTETNTSTEAAYAPVDEYRDVEEVVFDSVETPSQPNYLHTDYTDIPEIDAAPKSAELEALWPGVTHHDIFHMGAKKPPGFFITVGFVGGVAATLLGVWAFSWNWSAGTQTASHGQKIVVAQGAHKSAAKVGMANDNALVTIKSADSDPEVIVPLVSTYEVKNGDTLAGIAWQTYKRATPRLLDAICKANGMRSADVLNLGQKIVLPEYRPQTKQIAAGTSSSVQ